MFFLQQTMLWGLLAASIPIIIHLLNRRRHRTVKWAAMQFLLKATRESRGKKRLRHILILTCRTLGIAALATAAARPLVSGLIGWGANKPDLVVVVLDRSASMAANPKGGSIPRLSLSLQRVRDALADLQGTRVVLLDSASGTPQDVPSPDILSELSATAPTDTAADLPTLLSTAGEYLSQSPGRSEIWIASDLQADNWEPQNDRWESVRASLSALPQPPKIRVLALAGDSASNQAIQILSSRRAGDKLSLEIEISRGPEDIAPLNLPLSLNLNGARSTESLSLAGQSIRFQKSIAIPPREDTGHGWISIPGDGNPRDNVAYFAYGPARPIQSLVVASPGEAAEYLRIAAAPGGFGGQSTEVLDPANTGTLDTTEQSAILWAAPLPTGPAADELRLFVEDGGQLILFAPTEDSATSFLDMKWSPLSESPREQFFILDSWDHDDGLLRDGIDGTEVPADRLRAIKRRVPVGEASVLARWDDTEPFLVRRVVGRGTAWFAGSLPDYSWSNLGDADVLLPLVQRAVIAGADRFDSGFLADLGSAPAQLRPGETRTRIDDYASDSSADAEYLAGVFRLGERTIALNRPAVENLPDTLQAEALQLLFKGTDFTLFEDSSSSARESISRGVWRAFLIAMLFFLISEALLCLPNKSASQHTTFGAGAPPARPTTPHAR